MRTRERCFPPRHMALSRILAFFLLLGAAVTSGLIAQSTQPYSIDPTGRYLVGPGGKPFFISGDAAWSLFAQLSKSDADLYLQNRKAMGFNLVMASLIEHMFCSDPPRNAEGNAPFAGTAFSTAPNEAYFQHADYVINSAAQNGIVVLVAPVYLGYGCSDQGWCAEIQAASASDMRQWGRFLGNRYKDSDNIIWMIGGDTDPTPVAAKLREVIQGIQEYDTRHLFTAHNQPETFAISEWPSETWLTINNIYSYSQTLYTWSKTAYTRTPAMPFFMLESTYENEHGATQRQLRAQAYYTVLSGGAGHIFGNCPIWLFGYSSGWCGLSNWKAEISGPGSTSMKWMQAVMRSRYWHKFVPDFDHLTLTSGYGTWGQTDYVAAALAGDGSSIMAYLPSSRSITVDATRLTGDSVDCWWYNPSTGAATLIGTYGQASLSFSPPSSGDWVFVADDASLNFPNPGIPLDPMSVGEVGNMPESINLEQNYPNPFNGTTSIRYELPMTTDVQIKIFSVLGQEMTTLVDTTEPPGTYSVSWDGRDGSGKPVSSGIYLCVLETDRGKLARKMLYVK